MTKVELQIMETSRNKILVVEDDPDIGRIAQMILVKAEYSVRHAEHARMALEMIAQEMPNLILCDVMMPDMSGLELLELLKRDADTQHIPVLMMSALTDESDVQRGQAAGAEYYLKKPFSAAQLSAAVKGVFATHAVQERLLHADD